MLIIILVSCRRTVCAATPKGAGRRLHIAEERRRCPPAARGPRMAPRARGKQLFPTLEPSSWQGPGRADQTVDPSAADGRTFKQGWIERRPPPAPCQDSHAAEQCRGSSPVRSSDVSRLQCLGRDPASPQLTALPVSRLLSPLSRHLRSTAADPSSGETDRLAPQGTVQRRALVRLSSGMLCEVIRPLMEGWLTNGSAEPRRSHRLCPPLRGRDHTSASAMWSSVSPPSHSNVPAPAVPDAT